MRVVFAGGAGLEPATE